MDDASTFLDDFIDLLPHLDVVHHIPGRVRLKLRLSGLPVFSRMDVDEVLRRIPGLLGFRVKTLSRSVVVDYDHQVLPMGLWEKMDRFKRQPELEAELRRELGGLFAPELAKGG
ncbi:MAG: hypothetical protein GX443_06280 [Deltaproteobacteria bacterium]|nr:hypothetical protein [Deltaproteobacteria bacterium]